MRTILTLDPTADVAALRGALQALGVWATPLAPAAPPSPSAACPAGALALAAHSAVVSEAALLALPGVSGVLASASGHPRLDAQRGLAVRLTPTLATGPGQPPVLAAGPCGAESQAQVRAAAASVREAVDVASAASAGSNRNGNVGGVLRGGAYKPRTSPYAFAGVGAEALGWLRQAADEFDLALVTECLSERDAEAVAEAADLVQIGSRNMQNFALLRAVGATGKPALLKRGAAATLSEWRLAAEHLLAAGAAGVVLCERGIRGVDAETRNVLDLGAVALLSGVDRLAVWVDPSHAAGRRDLIAPLASAGLAAGGHGLLVETHPNAAEARSDGPQALSPDALIDLARGSFAAANLGAQS